MLSSAATSFEDFNRITELSNKVSKSLQNYSAARTAIRDYVIRLDEKYYAQVEQRLAMTIDALSQAESIADEDNERNSIHQLRDAIRAWSIIARQVHDAFADYQETVQHKVLANFHNLTQVGNVLIHMNSPLISGMMLDVQTANAAMTGYLMNGDDQFAKNAQRAIDSAKGKAVQAEKNNDLTNLNLEPFVTSLDAYAEGLQEAVNGRKNAYHLFEDHLSPLGVQIQHDAEQFHHQIIEYQGKNDEMRLTLMAELRHAVEHDELVLCFQPKIDLRTGIMNDVETLLQWLHPQRGFVRPDQFIPFAENTGYITAITRWVVDHALRQCAEWHAKDLPINIAVNISVRDLLDPGLPAMIGRLIDTHRALPEWLSLEITENAIMGDPTRSEKVLQALRDMGLKLSIDDYGTGYSSLAYLKKLKAQELKIDKSFVMDMAEDPHSVTIVRSTVELGHNLGLRVVAEGVEDKTTLDLLQAMGCDYAQGYYISKPLRADLLERWLEESGALSNWWTQIQQREAC